jgi:hypothetical protein
MALHYYQRQLDLSIAEWESRVRKVSLNLTINAEEGSNGDGIITLDDPNADFEPLPLKLVAVKEDEITDPDSQYIAVGYGHKRRFYRDRAKNFVGPLARNIDVEWYDLNEVLSRRLVRPTDDGDRPAESSDQRLTWIFDTPLTSLVDDTTTFVDVSAVAMDAADYTGQPVMSVLEDIGEATGFNYHIIWWGPSYTEGMVVSPWGKFTLVFCRPESTTFQSTARLTNVLADDLPDGSPPTFIVSDAELTHDPDEVYDGALMLIDGDSVYVHNDDTEAQIGGGRDVSLPSVNVKTTAKAIARATRMLNEDFSREERRGHVVWLMRPQDMGLIRAGMALDAKFTHLPEMGDAYVPIRLLNLGISQTVDETGFRLYKCESDFTFYVAPPTPPEPSCAGAPDYLGGTLTEDGNYFPAASVYPSTSSITGNTKFGTPNNGTIFGIDSNVLPGGTTVDYRVTWDLGDERPLCQILTAQQAVGGGNGSTRFEASHDGVTWDEIVSFSDYAAQVASGDHTGVFDVSGNTYRYVRLRVDAIGVSGFYFNDVWFYVMVIVAV